MKVSDVMQRKVETISVNKTVKDASRLIFGRSINGLPVVEGKKIVGFLTEKDILSKFYPSIEEYMEDPVNTVDFENMEQRISDVLAMPVKKIMNASPVTVKPDAFVLHAQSIMNINKVGRLPVVNNDGELVGILSRGDIFHALVGRKMPAEEEEGFYNWMAKQYDLFNEWEQRLPKEVPYLSDLFKDKKAKKIIDVASSTGEHSIALAKKGFSVLGIEASGLMNEIAISKCSKLDKKTQARLRFIKGEYGGILKNLDEKYDAAIFMGNGLPHVIETDTELLKEISASLNEKAILVFQMLNTKKALKDRAHTFIRSKVNEPYIEEVASLGFYSDVDLDNLIYTHAFIDFDGKSWHFKGIHSTTIAKIDEKKLLKMVKDLGFTSVKIYGSRNLGSLLKHDYDPEIDDWYTIVAER